MGIPDNSLLHLIKKISSWISWGNSEMSDNNCNMCCLCQAIISDACMKCNCQSCKRLFCEKCLSLDESKLCKLCFNLSAIRCSGKIYPSESPRQSPEPPSPSFSGDRSSENPSPVSVRHSPSRSDEDEGEDSSNFFSASSEYYHDTSDADSVCVSSRHDFCSFTTSVGSSPSDSPSRSHITSNRVGHFVQQDYEQALLEKPAKDLWDPQKVDEKKPPQPLDLESHGRIWLPPPPDDEENSFFTYDDDDEDDEIGAIFSPNNSMRDIVQGHFRLLVSQLLQAENCALEEWLNIITAISWQAANYIRPDTSRGGSMDPSDYIKVKCVASGSRTESKVIKGVVCTKNIKHKRMTSQYKNTRLLLLGGALEYQRDPNQLASFNTLLQQEKDYLKMVVSKIEAHRPNVLLVEKTVSSFAQDQLLAKEISLVLNVKRPLLEKIAKCTGAVIAPSTDSISTTRLGHCELFHLERISEDHEPVNQFNRKPSKTLMFLEGCPRRLGCTVVLRGSSREELKKVKIVVKYAIFAAYHLSLETSFLADEGASLPIRIGSPVPDLELGLRESLSELAEDSSDEISIPDEFRFRKSLSEACIENLAIDGPFDDIRSDNLHDSSEYFSSNDNNQSILVSFSSHSVLNGTICERPRLVRVKFYGPSDKPLGRYLRDDLFDKSCRCRSCKESSEGHAICYTHQNGNLTINVRQISSAKLLPGEQDGKIWMWHRCLKCTHTEGVPPATRRVIMSDAAWGLSFGKFLELSFSNHATGNRLASCGHSLQRDCLRFYGFGNMIAFFQYSPINILSVYLPPSILEFSCPGEQSWIRKEALELLCKAKSLYAEISAVLEEINQRSLSSMHEFSDTSDLHCHVLELYDMHAKEKDYYEDLLQLDDKEIIDILEINRLRHSLIIGSSVWDRRLYLLDSLLRRSSISKVGLSKITGMPSDNSEKYREDSEYKLPHYPKLQECCQEEPIIEPNVQKEENVNDTSLERRPSAGSILSDQIDSAWSGAELAPLEDQKELPSLKRLLSPTRVYSFDSAQILQERMKNILPNSAHLSTLRSFHASGDYQNILKDPVRNVQRTYSQVSPIEAEKLNLTTQRAQLSFISSTSLLPEGARLIVPQNGDIVVTVYDNDPTSIISHALTSKDYFDWILKKHPNVPERVNSVASDLSTWQSFGSSELDNFGNYNSEDASAEPKSSSPHLRISFKDDSAPASGRVKFSVTCYFAKQFDALRKRCCPNEVDFIRSLSRCMKWKAQGGKSNVYFAKSFDERFIIKQVTKTELESFDEFAPEYFKYLTDSLSSGSPTCLAKVLGLYQVSVKNSKGGKETKMELMVMENLFFGRSISKVYDLKGSERSRYNSDKTGANKVLLDMNLLETLRTNPIFLGSKAKRRLERAVWNDTSFLASVDVMDYSLLVGVDEERKELVLGIIDYMRQYTWDKHLETWVKASGILGGPKNASPTIVSPKQYKKRFRKAMTTYFLTVPDQWSSS